MFSLRRLVLLAFIIPQYFQYGSYKHFHTLKRMMGFMPIGVLPDYGTLRLGSHSPNLSRFIFRQIAGLIMPIPVLVLMISFSQMIGDSIPAAALHKV